MLVYDDPPASGRPGPAEPVRDGYRLSVGGAFSALRRRIVWIFACALVLAGIGLVVGKLLSPRYTAEAQIYIDPRDLNLVSRELTTGGQDSNAYQSVVESQTRLITSSSVLRRVVDATGLTRDDEFTAASGGMVSKVVAALGFGSQDAPSDDEGDANAAVGLLQQRISVRRTGRTYVIDVSVWARDAAKAARLANAVVAAYLAEDAAARTEAANRANSGLTARLGELRTALNAAENRVQAYRAETGLVGTRDALVSDQQLTQINAQLAAARARVVEAQARVEQSQRIARAGLDAGATDDILSSQTVAALRSQYADLTRRQAELTNELGPRHPSVSSMVKQVAQARRSIDQEVSRFAQAAQTDLAKARATASALEKNFDQAKGRTVGLAQASIRLRELEREAEASRSVYEAFLTRSRETGQQAYLDMGNARVVSPATKPIMRSFPPPARTLMAMGLLAGLGLGILLALLDDWARFGRSDPVRGPRVAESPMAVKAATPAREPEPSPKMAQAFKRAPVSEPVQAFNPAQVAGPAPAPIPARPPEPRRETEPRRESKPVEMPRSAEAPVPAGIPKDRRIPVSPPAFRAPDLPDPRRSAMAFIRGNAKDPETRPAIEPPVRVEPRRPSEPVHVPRAVSRPEPEQAPKKPFDKPDPGQRSSVKRASAASFSVSGAAALIGGAR
ncbi:Wzz/FepE/Etk N-terminal domain-containing protein [Methylobacterium sp. WCS2018Hpa-22]|uniref:GumC family protein n=1 Tax=Methylobacterium sp. WCS2018Hpa-22 TaxID=3073633 RepID=UPI00288C4317|nr:Wzz/FepE/Etk N-terminal domain-containing protein [Methylobacterium sp. WCS2018Hpa-22]